MGAIVGVVNKKNENAVHTVVSMLKTLKHEGAESFGMATPTIVMMENCVESLENRKIDSHVILGHIFSKILVTDKPQPIALDCGTLVFEGRIYEPTSAEILDVESVAEKLNQNPENAEELVKNFEGNFAFAMAETGRLIVGRDCMGKYPLYYGESANFAVLASERKALWKIGIEHTDSFPPGHIAVVDNCGFRFKRVKTLFHTRIKRKNMWTAAKELRRFLLQSVKQDVSGLKKIAVAFSGGLDSSVIAFLAKSFGVDVHLISVGLRKQPELEHIKDAAEALGLRLHLYFYDEKAVEKVLPKVLARIEEPNPINTSIGIPIFWTAENASKNGFKVILAGQGADELFAGYKRYLDYMRCGEKIVQKIIFNDILSMHRINFDRDSKICRFHNVELRLPFAKYQLAKFCASLPLQLKIESPNDELRKRLLRKVAEELGLPRFIVNKPKRAIQYSTGVNKIVQRLAKNKGFSTRKYLETLFKKIFKTMV